MEIPLEGTDDIAMAAEGKLLAEIQKMFCLVGTLQEQSAIMTEQLVTFDLKLSISVDGTKQVEKKSAATEGEITPLGEGEEERVQQECKQKPATFGNQRNREDNQGNTSLQGQKKREAPGITRLLSQQRMNKFDGDFFLGLDFGRFVPIGQIPSLFDLEERKYEELETELHGEGKTNKKDYKQNRRGETNWGLRASDVRNPG